jgi:ATP-dependent Lhr-like helicase
VSVFARLAPRLQQAIVARLGWSSLRPVQELAGEALLDGRNAVVLAPTAGGKTEASMFPTLSQLVEHPAEGVGALYVAPIKALLNNQAERLGLYTDMVGLRRFVWHGDVPDGERRAFLRDPAELLMTTPESLEVMLVSRRVDASRLFGDLRVVVVDEVHALAGTDRGAHLMSVVERLAAISHHDLQRVGLSATVGNPADILAWLRGSSRREGAVVDPPKAPARRQILVVHRDNLPELARDAAQMARGQKSLFFCQTRRMTEAVAEQMRRAGTAVFVHHSAVSREERELAEAKFHGGSDACIVCTSTLELGIDVGDLDRVLQAEAPTTVGSFLQRMGRTGRRPGQTANTTFLCESVDAVLLAIAVIELARAGWVEDVRVQARCWPVLVHQLLALALADGGVPPEDAWRHLSRVPDLAGIHRAEFDRLIAWMLRDGALVLLGGRLGIGPKVERRFGRRNFADLYSVFSNPQSYTVFTGAGQELGELDQDFVDRLVEGVSSFLLAGRAWSVLAVDHASRRIRVEPAPRGREPTWSGILPRYLGFEVCQRILAVLTGTEAYPWLHATAEKALADRRAALSDVLEPERGGLEEVEDAIRWWTFAGGRINGTLRYALQAMNPDWKVVPDNFALAIRGEGVTRLAFEEAVRRLSALDIWEDKRLWAEVMEGLPNYRLSKFQPLLPPWIEREMVATYLLDIAGAWRWLTAGAAPAARLDVASTVAHVRPTELPLRPPPGGARPTLPIHWVGSQADLISACARLRTFEVVGLDVETTLDTRALCLVQLAASDEVVLIDALEVEDLAPLGMLLGDRGCTKVIHNAAFERQVLGRHGLTIESVFDTLAASRERHGRGAAGGHGLAAVCARELGLVIDKAAQTSDWTRRPLTDAQIAYAALDAEVLLRLHRALRQAVDTPPR